MGNLLIKGGTVIDPARNFVGKSDVLIQENQFVEITPDVPVEVEEVINAAGYLVTPGLIDNHTHIFYGATESGFVPDVALLPMGVTTAVDAGSSGTSNCHTFMRTVVNQSQMRIFCTLNVSPAGQVTERYPENLDPRNYDLGMLKELFAQYNSQVTGLKIRCGEEVVKEFGLDTLKAAVNLAEALECRLTVHTTNPPGNITEIASQMRPGDIFCHCYHGKGSTIIDAEGKVKRGIWEARRRGVLFDTADARVNHSYPVIQAALAEKFAPDIISTDLTQASLFGNMVFGLPAVMSRYLSLGVELPAVIKACTSTPAEINGMKGRLGTLAPGAIADVAIFQLTDKEFLFKNRLGETFSGNKLLVPKLTILNGKIVFRQIDFPF
ncbi:metallo-dependent hydrolase [Sporomusa acidovorans]|uniref:Deacetylase n=1 Tax=Sporomusa acidovorans (strain ATCC 49682 / DSM 3132 / Mol) TaxID=1123286 RepID=A0ABZ3J631_SPOA4|nr:metallo-dependent hydrolase [Sporomusa acidovorans]OZC15696.1 deacetylase [Sporomusa acidovorans DSM 3132]SDE89145.1 Predicted amidohydrolase [Sporomusa acidovorans]